MWYSYGAKKGRKCANHTEEWRDLKGIFAFTLFQQLLFLRKISCPEIV
jgi:hypothetical protein